MLAATSQQWFTAWMIVLGLTTAAFGVMAVIVSIGSIRDILWMFRELSGTNAAEPSEDSSNGDN
jgi:hypothetical protein